MLFYVEIFGNFLLKKSYMKFDFDVYILKTIQKTLCYTRINCNLLNMVFYILRHCLFKQCNLVLNKKYSFKENNCYNILQEFKKSFLLDKYHKTMGFILSLLSALFVTNINIKFSLNEYFL